MLHTMYFQERRRLKERYPSLLLVGNDDRDCLVALASYQAMLSSKDICEGRCVMGQTCPTGKQTHGLYSN